MALVNHWPFRHLLISGNQNKKNVLNLTWKHAFLGLKNDKFKQSKIKIFPKGLTHGFAPKIAIFQTFFQAILARKISFTTF